ncbi:PREDICTED: LOW QUALITY PROTEIN: (RS)-norcoclaurine 6-O-methyltransferase-like [Tarenaya hassleriana]|uniref:LOW QUALITY PROTEIN: (RS)-norcoclaurine 6-O-methyltransferase-like n=1 Tax=Tarenaya hassleriana TaxID=28532 RepID=UPI00053C29AF|nr:PREDICTED: LOW QUALITY PROTEIN: (RS)-norcoclaurine 6-O-methyltransferase-like [Tarenaya hassleriana]
MEEGKIMQVRVEEEEEAKIWRYAFGLADVAVVKCAIDLKIPDAVENHTSQPVTLADLSAAVSCSPALLRRIMRFLVHQGIFREEPTKDGGAGYTNTPLSRRRPPPPMALPILLACSPVMMAPWLKLTDVVSGNGPRKQPFEAAHGKDAWAYTAEDPRFNEMFSQARVSDTRMVVPAVVGSCADVFDGVSTVVDVGGRDGEAIGILVKAFPWIKGVNFDLPHVVEAANKVEGVENVGGDMFDSIPHADAVFIKWILHNWNDEDCIKILRKCKEAMPEEKGKVIIVEAVVGQKKDDKLEYARLLFDMTMMTQMYEGKERTLGEWAYVLREAGFARHEIRDINCVQSVIVASVS